MIFRSVPGFEAEASAVALQFGGRQQQVPNNVPAIVGGKNLSLAVGPIRVQYGAALNGTGSMPDVAVQYEAPLVEVHET